VKQVLKGIWAIPVIASILILGSLGLIQEADAADRTFTVNTVITSSETIATGESWDINSGVTLTINAGVTINNKGIIDNRGTIKNSGTINNFKDGLGFFNIGGTIINSGLIKNFPDALFANTFDATIILVDNGSLIGSSTSIFTGGTTVGASCGSGTTLSGSTNKLN